MVIYTAGPIDYNNEKQSWKDKLKEYILTANPETVFYNPAEAFTVGSVIDNTAVEFVYNVNMNALRESNLVVAYISSKSPSVGTPIEIATAAEFNIPLIIYTDMRKSMYLKYYECQGAVVVSSDSQDAMSKLRIAVNDALANLNKLANNYPKRFNVNTEQQ